MKTNDINYWLDQWIIFYEFIKKQNLKENDNLIFIDYNDLCNKTDIVFEKVSESLGENIFDRVEKNFFSFKKYETNKYNFNKEKVLYSLEIYNYLKN